MTKQIKSVETISLFSGIGGFEYGMHDIGFAFRANLEFDEECVGTLNANAVTSAGREIVPLDITQVPPSEFYGGNVDYIVGGPPCQSFSAAGRRAGGVSGIDDARGTLFWFYCQYVEHFRPKAFVFENVRGILSSKSGADFDLICRSFKSVGYDLYWRILNSADYGVPQFRERLYLVGVREDLEIKFCFPRPTHGPDSPNQVPFVTANDAIGHLDDPNQFVPPYGGKYGHLLPEIPEGENYRHFTEEMGHPQPQFAWRSKFSGFLYKMARNEPCRTIVSQQSRYDGPLHWRNRKCTADELKLLQGFPDTLKLPASYSAVVKQIGNSVTPPVARMLGMALRFQIEAATQLSVPLLHPEETLTFDRRKGERARLSRAKKVKTVTTAQAATLFDEPVAEIPVHFARSSREWTSDGFHVTQFLEGRDYCFELSDVMSQESAAWFNLSLHFVGDFQRQVNSLTIRASGFSNSASTLRLAWQISNDVIRENSSYESLQPLWGHFTEPYPKFNLNFDSTRDDLALRLQTFAIERGTKKSLVPFAEVSRKIGSVDKVLICARSIGLDIRTNETNRTIREGYARFCYPFAVQSA